MSDEKNTPAPNAEPAGERCPRCERECGRILAHRMKARPTLAEIRECEAHAVDWRARCLASEDARRKADQRVAELTVAKRTAEIERDEIKLALNAPHDWRVISESAYKRLATAERERDEGRAQLHQEERRRDAWEAESLKERGAREKAEAALATATNAARNLLRAWDEEPPTREAVMPEIRQLRRALSAPPPSTSATCIQCGAAFVPDPPTRMMGVTVRTCDACYRAFFSPEQMAERAKLFGDEPETSATREGEAKPRACGNADCAISTGLAEELTFGRGDLDENGYWSIPCVPCARDYQQRYPRTDCWPLESPPPSAGEKGGAK